MSNTLLFIFLLLIIQQIVAHPIQNLTVCEKDCFSLNSSLEHNTPIYNPINEYNIVPIVAFMYFIGFF